MRDALKDITVGLCATLGKFFAGLSSMLDLQDNGDNSTWKSSLNEMCKLSQAGL